MDIPGRPVHLTSTGNVAGAADGGVCRGILLAAGTAAGSVTVREGGSGGTIITKLTVAANGGSESLSIPFAFVGQLHFTIAGAGVEATAFI